MRYRFDVELLKGLELSRLVPGKAQVHFLDDRPDLIGTAELFLKDGSIEFNIEFQEGFSEKDLRGLTVKDFSSTQMDKGETSWEISSILFQ